MFDPLSGNIPHASEQPSLCATAIGLLLQSLQAATTEPIHSRSYSLKQEKLMQHKEE